MYELWFMFPVAVVIATMLMRAGELAALSEIIWLLFYSVPGVVLGAQLGVSISNRIKADTMGRFVGALFLILAAATFFTLGANF